MYIQIEISRSSLIFLTFFAVGIFMLWPEGSVLPAAATEADESMNSVAHAEESMRPDQEDTRMVAQTREQALPVRRESPDILSFPIRARNEPQEIIDADVHARERMTKNRRADAYIGGTMPAHPERTSERKVALRVRETTTEIPRPPSLTRASPPDARGGNPTVIRAAEKRILQARLEQDLLRNQEEILRGQLQVLEEERQSLDGETSIDVEEQIAESARSLKAILLDQRRTEEFILQSFRELWDAQGAARSITEKHDSRDTMPMTRLLWPVDPSEGISAYFQDASYLKRFGFPHDAIDIPILQGSIVRAAADGTVVDVTDNGLGFNSVTIRHAGGVATLYGHLTSFLVKDGDKVFAGDPIGKSGGRPGTPGAGISTGPHLHLEVFRKGENVDPLGLLPPLAKEY